MENRNRNDDRGFQRERATIIGNTYNCPRRRRRSQLVQGKLPLVKILTGGLIKEKVLQKYGRMYHHDLENDQYCVGSARSKKRQMSVPALLMSEDSRIPQKRTNDGLSCSRVPPSNKDEESQSSSSSSLPPTQSVTPQPETDGTVTVIFGTPTSSEDEGNGIGEREVEGNRGTKRNPSGCNRTVQKEQNREEDVNRVAGGGGFRGGTVDGLLLDLSSSCIDRNVSASHCDGRTKSIARSPPPDLNGVLRFLHRHSEGRDTNGIFHVQWHTFTSPPSPWITPRRKLPVDELFLNNIRAQYNKSPLNLTLAEQSKVISLSLGESLQGRK